MSTTDTDIPTPVVVPPPRPRPSAAPQESAWPIDAPSRPPRRRRRRAIVAIAAVLLVTGGVVGARHFLRSGPTENIQLFTVVPRTFPVVIEEEGELKATRTVDIKSELEGWATIIYLRDEGSRVKKGDLLVEVASDEIDDKIREAEIKVATNRAAHEAATRELEILQEENASKIRKAELALSLATQGLEKYELGDAEELRQEAKLELEQAQFEHERAVSYLKDSEELFKQGFITRIERDQDRFDAYKAEIQKAKAQVKLNVLEKYTIPMSLTEKRSDVDEARKELDRTRKAADASEAKATADVAGKKTELTLVEEKLKKLVDQKSKAKIYAPSDGLVAHFREEWWDRDRIKPGEKVQERQTLIELPDTSSMKLVVRVHESQIKRLKEGMEAQVEIQGFKGRTFTGRVCQIGVLADSQRRWWAPNIKEYLTEIQLDGTFTDLKPGLTGRARIELARLENVLAVPVQSVFGKGGRFYVFAGEGGSVRPVEVKPGLASTEYVEITSGLQAGQTVRLAVTDEMKLMLPDIDEDDANGGHESRPNRSDATPGATSAPAK